MAILWRFKLFVVIVVVIVGVVVAEVVIVVAIVSVDKKLDVFLPIWHR